jgi:hypothetical protein
VDPTDRKNPRFTWLRGVTDFKERLQTLVNQTVSVPQFPLLPKGLTTADLDRIILSQQRTDLLCELNDQMTDGENTAAGYVLSGPQGIGKSVEMYLFASYLYVNKHPLVYVPSCQMWKDAPYAHLVEQFCLINHDRLDKLVSADLATRIGTFLESTKDQEHSATAFWREIKTQVQRKRVRLCMLFDEHNELFKDTPPFIERLCVSSLLSRSRFVVLT